ncbi:hypothetical protein [Streptomyces profundus]|uniref:hypothetical protein n=1 Tax=Streptomyces profundus TaxID=2867410 RepID=UPI001D1645CA|nr:hypothetical protein [Streptomyces sp. MA3_2.13]UED87385.1 hypothetical protein K4G22_26850 [Streptomyces sp. MA3_2.13]
MASWFSESRQTPDDSDPFEAAERLRLAHRDTGDPGLLEDARRATSRAKDHYGTDDPRHAASLSGLCMIYRLLWERAHDRRSLDTSVAYGRQAVEVSLPGDALMPRHMSSLAMSLQELFEATRDVEAIDESIALSRGALDLVPHHDPEHAGLESNLANALLRRTTHHPDAELQREAVEHARAALRDTPPGDPMLPARHINLGGALLGLGGAGSVSHFLEAQTMYERGLRALPRNHPARPGIEATVRHLQQVRRSLGI